MEKLEKKSLLITGVLLVVVLSFFSLVVYLTAEVAPVATGYAAKRLCSCVFLSHRDPDSVLGEELKAYPYVSSLVDYEGRTVTCSIMGLAKRKAVYREGLGSTLVVGVSEQDLRKQAEGFTPVRHDRRDLNWPDGDAVKKEPLPKGIDAAALKKAVDGAFEEPDPAKPRRTRAVVVACGGRIIAEKYAPGFTRDTSQLGWSMTKSVTGILVGILVKEGKLSIKALAPMEEWRSPGDPRAGITLDQLLRMSSGLKFGESYQNPFSDVVRMLFTRPDAGAYAASMPLEHQPDAHWQYSSGTTNILSLIVRHAVGGSLSEYFSFPRRALFDKIGMTSAIMEPDPSGTFVGSSFMYATPRDWTRLGLLCLNDGVWDGKRILPEGWMKYCTTPAPAAPQGKYGAKFWLNAGTPVNVEDRPMPRVPPDTYFMWGFEGQYVTVIPSKKLVVVRMGLSAKDQYWSQEEFLVDILKALPREKPKAVKKEVQAFHLP